MKINVLQGRSGVFTKYQVFSDEYNLHDFAHQSEEYLSHLKCLLFRFGTESDLSWLLLDSPKDPINELTPTSEHGQEWELGGDPCYSWIDSAVQSDPKSPSSTRTSNSSCQTTVNEKTKKAKKKSVLATGCPNQVPPDDDAERKRKVRGLVQHRPT